MGYIDALRPFLNKVFQTNKETIDDNLSDKSICQTFLIKIQLMFCHRINVGYWLHPKTTVFRLTVFALLMEV